MLKFKRKSLGLSQKCASKKLHISPNTLSAIENKRCTNLNLNLIHSICNLYKLDFKELINWLESK